jgi:multicomponent Na+:H+ antiporter subunit A
MGAFRPETVILNWLLMLPFFAALCAELFPRLSIRPHSEREAEAMHRAPFMLGALASVMGLLLAVSLFPSIFRTGPVTADYWWTKDLYHLRFQADSFTTPLAAVIWGLGLLIQMHFAGLPGRSNAHRRAALALLAQGGALGACLSADLIALSMFLSVALVALWLLALLDDAGAANRFLAMTYVGSLMLLAGLLLIWLRATDSSLASLPYLLVSAEPQALSVMATLVLLGSLPMLAGVPGHAWLPGLTGSAPRAAAVAALLLPAAMGGVLLRLLPGSFPLEMLPAPAALALILGVAALWWGAIRAWTGTTLGEMAAWLTVAQAGALLIAIGAIGGHAVPPGITQAAALQALAAPLALAAVWGAAGVIRAQFGTDAIAELKGLARTAPLATAALFLGGLSLAGLPPLPGFQVQRLLVSGLFHSGRAWFAVVLVAGDVLVALAVLDAVRRGWLGAPATSPRWSSAWHAMQLGLVSLALLAGGAAAESLVGWSEAVLRAVFSLSRSGLGFAP